MACLKLGSKSSDGFQRKGQAWFCTTGLPSDVTIEVEEMLFHLHKFPLVSKSARLAEALAESADDGATCKVELNDIPGGPDAFELAAKFCYGVKLELTSANAVVLRCAAEYLGMTEEVGEGNLISRTEGFLKQVVFHSWKDCVRALSNCEAVLPYAEDLGIVKRCVDSLVMMACTDPSLFGWPMAEHGAMQSPGGSLLWNGISTGARPRNFHPDWWYDDVSVLSLPLYERLIVTMEGRGIRPEVIAGALGLYAKRRLPVLNRRRRSTSKRFGALSLASIPPETDQKLILETIEKLLPPQKGVVSTRLLSGLLRSAIILNASWECKDNLEKRIGCQLERASLEDLLLPNLSDNLDVLYDMDCFQRILEHFLSSPSGQSPGVMSSSPYSVEEGQIAGSTPLTPIMAVARLTDTYLAEIASDVNLKPSKFREIAEALPEYSRKSDDGLYRAVDIYLKAHPWFAEEERENICHVMNCQKLSLEACTHAAQNERLPLRIIVQVLFFEQLQLRTAIASSFMASDNVDTSHPFWHPPLPVNEVPGAPLPRGEGFVTALRENQVLKEDMDSMKQRVNKLEQECNGIRQEMEKMGKLKGLLRIVPRKKTTLNEKLSPICTTKNEVSPTQKSFGPSRSAQLRHRRNTTLA